MGTSKLYTLLGQELSSEKEVYDWADANSKLEWLFKCQYFSDDENRTVTVFPFWDVEVFNEDSEELWMKNNAKKRKKMEEETVSELIGLICAFACYFL